MKTTKILFAIILLSLTVYSCSTDREEEGVNPTSNQKVDLKKLKTINNNQSGTAKIGDSIIDPPKNMPATASDPGSGLEPIDGGDPKDVPPRR